MQQILSRLRRCIEDYEMIRPGDRIAVGVSGGKDSLTLLYAMAKLRAFYPVPFELHALTVHPGVQHAFFNDERPEVYDVAAATTAWTATLDLFRSTL